MCAYVDFVENPVSQLCRNSDTSSTVEGGVEGKEKKVEWEKERRFLGGLGSQMDWKECLECEKPRRTHAHFLKLSPALCCGQIKVTGW